MKMLKNKKWFLLETEADYDAATNRYEQLKDAKKGSEEHKEKMLLVHLIAEYENKLWDLPKVDPVEMIKIRMEDFGYNAATLAKAYGDVVHPFPYSFYLYQNYKNWYKR